MPDKSMDVLVGNKIEFLFLNTKVWSSVQSALTAVFIPGLFNRVHDYL